MVSTEVGGAVKLWIGTSDAVPSIQVLLLGMQEESEVLLLEQSTIGTGYPSSNRWKASGSGSPGLCATPGPGRQSLGDGQWQAGWNCVSPTPRTSPPVWETPIFVFCSQPPAYSLDLQFLIFCHSDTFPTYCSPLGSFRKK